MSDPRVGPWARTALAATAAALLGALAVAAPAQAHNQFVGSTPEAGTTVTDARSTISLAFTEAVNERFTELAVTGPDGQPLEIGEPSADVGTLTAEVAFTDSGEHTIGYRVVSDDGHPVEGEIGFTVDLPAGATASGESAASDSPSTEQEASASEVGAAGWVPTALVIGAIVAIGALALTLPRRR